MWVLEATGPFCQLIGALVCAGTILIGRVVRLKPVILTFSTTSRLAEQKSGSLPRWSDTMLASMALDIAFELHGDVIHATVTGTFSLKEAVRLFRQLCDTAADKKVSKILINNLNVHGNVSTMDRYEFGGEMARQLKQRQINLRLAFVGRLPVMDGFAAIVAQNQGVVTEVFSTEHEALRWLDLWRSAE